MSEYQNPEIKYIDIKEFRELGFLQEINRLILHPAGLALEISLDDEGNETLGGVWDCRNDPEGVTFDSGLSYTKALDVRLEWLKHTEARRELLKENCIDEEFGRVVQLFD